jgi:hypothetical protein
MAQKTRELREREKASALAAKQIEIERGISVPPPGRLDRVSKYPFADMQVDDSFFVPEGKAANIQACLFRFKNSPHGAGKKFTVRSLTESNVEGVRVWRKV